MNTTNKDKKLENKEDLAMGPFDRMFDNHKPCAIRRSNFKDYWDLLDKWEEEQRE